MEDAYTPVAKAKPERGREIKSAKMQTDMLFESLKAVSENSETENEHSPEIYHEGYIDGQKYLVPDSNLEAMKDMINLKMRPRRSLRYKHQTSYEISDYDHFKDKLQGLLSKMDHFDDRSSESSFEPSVTSSKSDRTDNNTRTETDKSRGTGLDSREEVEAKQADSKESRTSRESPATLKMVSPESAKESRTSRESTVTLKMVSSESAKESRTSETAKESRMSRESLVLLKMGSSESVKQEVMEPDEKPEPQFMKWRDDSFEEEPEPKRDVDKQLEDDLESMEPEPPKFPDEERVSPDLDECRIRFLVSGHLRDDRPIYIVQEYNDQPPDIFQGQCPDFSDSNKKGNTDILISGKFYKENILEELDGEPISLTIAPKKIMIDEKSKVYSDSFSDIFDCEKVVIVVSGEFLRHEITSFLTPILTFSIEPKIQEFRSKEGSFNSYSDKAPSMVIHYTPRYVNRFASELSLNNDSNTGPHDEDATDTSATIKAPKCPNPLSRKTDSVNNVHELYDSDLTKSNVSPFTAASYTNFIVNTPKYKNYFFNESEKGKNRQPIHLPDDKAKDSKLNTYVYSDDKGEYYSTFKDDLPYNGSHLDDVKQVRMIDDKTTSNERRYSQNKAAEERNNSEINKNLRVNLTKMLFGEKKN